MDLFVLGLNFRFLDFNDTLKEIDANGILSVPPGAAILLLTVFSVVVAFIKWNGRR